MKLSATATGLVMAVSCSSILLSGRAHAQFSHETMEEREKRRMIDEENERFRQEIERSKEMSVRHNINVIVMLAGELAGAEMVFSIHPSIQGMLMQAAAPGADTIRSSGWSNRSWSIRLRRWRWR